MKKLILICSILLTQSLLAKEVKLFDMQIENEKKITPLRLVMEEDGEAKGMVFDYEGKDIFISVKDVKSSNGAVVMEFKGHELAYLKSRDLDVLRGGNFQLEYIKSVLFGGKGVRQFSLEFDGRNWAAFHNGEKIEKLEIKPGSTGIKAIEVKVE